MRDPTKYCVLFSFLILLLSSQTFSQTHISEKIQFKHLTTEDGLSNNLLASVVKDSKGFVWIATLDGLNRYDGKKIKTYRHSEDDPNSLGSNEVFSLCVDPYGTLWIGADSRGLNRYNPETDNFTRYLNPNDSTALANTILIVISDKSGILWLGTHHGGLHSFEPKTEKFTSYVNIPGDSSSLSHNYIWALLEDSKGNLWIGTIGGGLNKFNRENGTFTRYQHDPVNPNSLSNDLVPGICEDKSGALWLGTYGGGINKLTLTGDNDSPVFTHYKYNPRNPSGLSGNNIDCIIVDKNNVPWFGTAQTGLNRSASSLDNNDQVSIISYQHDPYDPSSLIGNSIRHLFVDDDGVYWISSYGGLNIYNSKQKQFRNYKHEAGNPFSFKGDFATTLLEDKSGAIWIGTQNGGLNKWDRKTDKIINLIHDPYNPNSISENTVKSLGEDKDGYIWVGTYAESLNKFDKKTGKFVRYKHDPLKPGTVSEITLDRGIVEDKKSGLLWIATPNKGFNIYNKETDSFFNIYNNPDSLKILSSNLYTSIRLIDRNGIFWIATKEGGIVLYDPEKDELKRLEYNPDEAASLGDNSILAVYEDKTGFYWIGTGGGGLFKLDKRDNKFLRYSIKDGLPGEVINSILEDDHGNLWISTNNGLSKFNPVTESFRNYDIEDGLLGNDVGKGINTRSGEMLFICGSGFMVFHPDSIKVNIKIPPVYITDFYLFNKPVSIGYDSLSGRTVLPKSITLCEEIKLNFDDNVFSFEFAALDYSAPMKNKYSYMMEGFDKDWNYTDAVRNLATYTNLDPGEYIFRVKGSNNDGYWNENGASIKVIILPPWWRTNFAYLIYFILIGSIIYFIWKAQLKRIKIKNEFAMSRFEAQKLHEVDELKSRFFANISHEFRTPLTLILGPAKDVLKSTQEPKTKQNVSLIKRNAKKLLGLVNQLLDISKLESGNMKLQTTPMNIIPLLKGLVLSFSSYAERKRIIIKFNSVENEIIVYLDKEKFEKIITNILSNAFKFTPEGGSIEVKASPKSLPKEGTSNDVISPPRRGTKGVGKESLLLDNYIQISITDTGIGIPADRIEKIFDRFYQVDGSHTREHEGTGIGLSLTKELVELHKGKIEVESEPGKGSTFTVSLPLGKDHLRLEEICEPDEVKADESEPRQRREYEKEISETKEEEESKPEGIRAGLIEKDSFPLLLIVEDNSDVQAYIKDNLKTDYRILEAADGEDGWYKSIEEIPDLIVSDVMMPKMDGFKLCEKLKTDERTSHIPVILLTAKAAKEDKLAGFETGADEYLMKPFDTDELKSRIKNLIEQRKRLQGHFRKQGLIGIDQQNITSVDKMFLKKSLDLINQHISDSSFSVEMLAEELAISRSGLQKKIHSLIGETPGDLIRRIRLNKAAELIKQKFGNLSEIALEVGYNNPAHFSEAFKRQFGVAPSQYLNNKTP
jgi:signal transduction histidine kinase/ligand-binding sensor domain-containing protein/DNA-binding response OmpR family regulator